MELFGFSVYDHDKQGIAVSTLPHVPTPLRMFYFGPWDQAGHHIRREGDQPTSLEERRAVSNFTRTNPWGHGIDTALCPRDTQAEGAAAIHYRDGWTALSFWDYTVDSRPGSHSTYLAQGDFTFEQMVEMAKQRFAERWRKMKFEVKLVPVVANV